MSDLREALARLLQEAQGTVKHSEKCDLLTHYAEASSGSGFPIVWLRADCSCDYAQRIRERQAAVMAAGIVACGKATEWGGFDSLDWEQAFIEAGRTALTKETA